MASVLDEVASTAEDVARDQQRVAARARTMQRRRVQGWSWATILDAEPAPGVFDLLRDGARSLTRAAARFGLAVSAGLAAEGASRRMIAKRLGVTHQRVTALLARPAR